MFKKTIAGGLSFVLILLSAGLQPYEAFAQNIVSPKVRSAPVNGGMAMPVGGGRSGIVGSQSGVPASIQISGSVVAPAAGVVSVVPGLVPSDAPAGTGLPSAAVPAAVLSAVPVLAPLLSRNQAAASVPGDRFGKMVSDLQAPSPLSTLKQDAPAEDRSAAGTKDFELRLGLAVSEAFGEGASAQAPETLTASGLLPSGRQVRDASAVEDRTPAAPAPRPAYRSAFFGPSLAAAAAGISIAIHAALSLAAKGVALVSPAILSDGGSTLLSGLGLAVQASAVSAGAAVAVCAVAAVAAVSAFALAMRRGAGVSDEDFQDFVRGEVLAGRIDPGLGALVKPYRPVSRWDFNYGALLNGRVYIRPELSASPALFTTVLAHELEHLKDRRERGPPSRRGLSGLWERLRLEFRARRAERGHGRSVGDFHVPVLERSLNRAQLSLRREEPYDVLVVNPGSDALSDPKVYSRLSGGMARLETARTEDPVAVFKAPDNLKRFKVIAVDRPSGVLPAADSNEERKLFRVLRSLDD
ncbi:MAG: hypothetical protein WC943_16040, partial [Elusimicrobiota bacterium]